MVISRKAEPSWVDGNAETRTYGILKVVYMIKCTQQVSRYISCGKVEIYHISCTIDFTGLVLLISHDTLVRR